MNIYINNHKFHYEIENLTRVFFPNEKIIVEHLCSDLQKPYIYTELSDGISVTVCIDDFCKTLNSKCENNDESDELEMASLLYKLLVDYSNISQPWGLLTGVRPIKLLRRLIEKDGEKSAKKYFLQKLFVSDSKTQLAVTTEKIEKSILQCSSENSFSLYVSIPFCPSRCSYCSFVSQSVEKAKHLMQPYTELLCKEIAYTAQIAKGLNLKLETVYIGGGTPTSLTYQQLDMIINAIISNFDMASCREFTVEAGRPDTITPEKLQVLKNNNVNRISINPQTLNDSVLEQIGRRHTAKQTLEAFELSRKMGFDHINMDLIAGLPTDTLESFCSTLDKIYELDPESITVHTLAMKRSSSLTENGLQLYREDALRTSEMLNYVQNKLSASYIPYYLYRQSRMVGNLENVGWSKKGYECYYNVYVMDETHTILGCGAGAVTKLKQYGTDYLERIFNFKYPYEYTTRFDELIMRKQRISQFYSEFNGK